MTLPIDWEYTTGGVPQLDWTSESLRMAPFDYLFKTQFEAQKEKCNASATAIPAFLSADYNPLEMIYTYAMASHGLTTILIPYFVDHTQAVAGSFDGMTYVRSPGMAGSIISFPMWSNTSIMEYLNETRIVPNRMENIFPWFVQQYKILNLLKWRRLAPDYNKTSLKRQLSVSEATLEEFVDVINNATIPDVESLSTNLFEIWLGYGLIKSAISGNYSGRLQQWAFPYSPPTTIYSSYDEYVYLSIPDTITGTIRSHTELDMGFTEGDAAGGYPFNTESGIYYYWKFPAIIRKMQEYGESVDATRTPDYMPRIQINNLTESDISSGISVTGRTSAILKFDGANGMTFRGTDW